MGILLRMILWMLGFQYKIDPNQTPPTNTINAFFGSTKRPRLYGSILNGSVVFVGLALLLYFKFKIMTHEVYMLSYLFCACTWSLFGPVFIWWYEQKTLQALYASALPILHSRSEQEVFSGLIFSPVIRGTRNRLFLFGWILLIVYSYARAMDFMRGFGIHGLDDAWWWIIFGGVILYAYYTGIGFLLAFKTIDIVRLLSKMNPMLNPYHQDQTGGLGFVGNFAVTTSLMFWSGMLFLPLMLALGRSASGEGGIQAFVIVGVYTACILLPFAYPVWRIHRKIVRSKLEMATPIRSALYRLLAAGEFSFPGSDKWALQSAFLRDIIMIQDWPFNLRNALQITISGLSPVAYLLMRIYFQR